MKFKLSHGTSITLLVWAQPRRPGSGPLGFKLHVLRTFKSPWHVTPRLSGVKFLKFQVRVAGPAAGPPGGGLAPPPARPGRPVRPQNGPDCRPGVGAQLIHGRQNQHIPGDVGLNKRLRGMDGTWPFPLAPLHGLPFHTVHTRRENSNVQGTENGRSADRLLPPIPHQSDACTADRKMRLCVEV
jgi:hypothetical protein